ncbi:nucleoside triphosphate pyrophosphohydrolase [Acinetobacter larvae]|uniref:Nucleoside triphosphate pyrophosphohydrolase n=1 Tax=Acinetobacter larvae TaxID=1789224 RepID=A0A1B2M1V4_9GAMM|nr:nucleoside triphosphate pyrophosphohydrolase [Acinetobacter larvae]AOA59174.1 nucleoside triphosphate pyrophosphohydrolase [Acinetobacter larvae]
MQQLLAIMQKLRRECPWDRQQTPLSLTPYAIEEAYEVEQAIQQGDPAEICEELGDLLLQVIFQAEMHAEQGLFDFQDVVAVLTQKLIRRHPHVFQAQVDDVDIQADDVAQVKALWQQIKQQERAGQAQSLLSAVKAGPALMQAQALQQQAAKVGFDFASVADAYGKLEEELGELQQAMQAQQSDEIREELGDCLFSLINVGRKMDISSEQALLATVAKFRQRFAYIEQQAAAQQKTLQQLDLFEMDQLWDQAKQQLKA